MKGAHGGTKFGASPKRYNLVKAELRVRDEVMDTHILRSQVPFLLEVLAKMILTGMTVWVLEPYVLSGLLAFPRPLPVLGEHRQSWVLYMGSTCPHQDCIPLLLAQSAC